MLSRTILNGRHMNFDVDNILNPDEGDEAAQIEAFAANLLSEALSISPETLEESPDDFVDFLNKTSSLRSLPLGELDLSSPATYCIIVNIYHCMLQHALLLTVNGPLHKVRLEELDRPGRRARRSHSLVLFAAILWTLHEVDML